MARASFRPGSRTSLPTKVTFVQVVCAKSGPIIYFQKSNAGANLPVRAKPGCATWGLQPFAQESDQADERAALFVLQPNRKPITTTPASAAVFANVKVFWTSLPTSSPRVFVQVRSAINKTAISCSVERLTAYPPKIRTGAIKYLSDATAGTKTPRNFANAIATAAIVPV